MIFKAKCKFFMHFMDIDNLLEIFFINNLDVKVHIYSYQYNNFFISPLLMNSLFL